MNKFKAKLHTMTMLDLMSYRSVIDKARKGPLSTKELVRINSMSKILDQHIQFRTFNVTGVH